MARPAVFIDGEHGTTGLLIRELLLQRGDVEVVGIGADKRKDRDERKRLLNAADLAILCLPDDAARESVAMIGNPSTRVIDASTAHRVAEGWTFGFAELDREQAARIAGAKRVANPGCWSTCYIALIRPLIDAGWIARDAALTAWGVSGYSGGGRQMIEAFENESGSKSGTHFMAYGMGLAHKHLPEMQKYSGLERAPVFTPSVGRFRQGMLLEVPLALWAMKKPVSGAQLRAALSAHYEGQRCIEVVPHGSLPAGEIDPEGLNGTNRLELSVYDNPSNGQAVLVARLDNLGKGAGRAAVQNAALMLGLPEDK
jgi:N-acetyl-gamma-glutamyl-phosphate reductase